MKRYLGLVTLFLFLASFVFSGTPSPNWEDQIIYFVMIDRFANGDTSNDVLTDSGIESGIVNSKYNGGDIQGLIDQLDYIKELGATAIWVTPPVANQWWDGSVNYGGYHGYWARDFKKVEEHFGDVELYKKFVEEAHKRGMYVIQDIVANHTGNFLIYKNGRYFLNNQSVPTNKPDQYPFNMNDYNDPEQRKLNVYHWPSEIKNPNQYNTEFSQLDDLNTENPLVIEALKDSYTFWIEEADIDGFRIDTAIYVPNEFWEEFLNGENGIYEIAQKVEKNDFLTYGEAWITPQPFTNVAEKSLNEYMEIGFNSMLDFPLQTDIKRVFKEGKPTSYLEYRLNQRETMYKDPSRMITFIDNHDMDRFLKGSDINSLKQALTFIFTIPGIPTIYYGTEQNFVETRAAMFEQGFASGGVDHFDTTTPTFQYIKELTELRKNIPTFRYGKVEVLFADELGPGPFIYKVKDESKSYIILMNTSSNKKHATDVDLGIDEGTILKPILVNNMINKEIVYSSPLNILLNAKAIGIFEVTNEINPVKEEEVSVEITNLEEGQTFSENFVLKGTASNAKSIQVIVDREEKEYAKINLTQKQNEPWEIPINISDFTPGQHNIFVKAYGRTPLIVDYSESYNINFEIPMVTLKIVEDSLGDDKGPNGTYSYPKDPTFNKQMDIKEVELIQIGTMLRMVVTMENVTDIWNPANGFDHVTFQIFFDDPDKKGAVELPFQNATMPNSLDWDYEVYATGWGISLFSSENSSANKYGDPITPAPTTQVNKQENKITFMIPLSTLDTSDLSGWTIYITTYDYDGIEGVLRPLSPNGGPWSFGGGNPTDPKIMDDVLIKID
ncbi:alpha-amylase [Petrotoga sp. HWH.PT.55.6.1]|uniref:alpha-amylase family glycosyl hydrolase n=1 Tax=unclassified Petrotoga TaxID=2620614 RepID=UPI000C9FFC7F|nr:MULTISPECIES: alpha-amylase family glycosyl hydrolase [unclassified Petrotoga]MBL5981455.1 alpha-amylase [Petrotoga sp. 8T1HF07.NaAc.6.1]PNR90081.1 alpha-amylase [Petrotoga sp. 9T1HF07.CasAA.8.2]PNR92368.1 alpha-amylase [Petrotoga sp. HWHPT.55.6.3]RPD35296.1 alpha-amylase [Petrotoga sp. HWH.PT.55.6.1]